METLFQKHCREWSNCQRCYLSEERQRVVLARGQIPCDLLFIGEAPGESEDTIGIPFCGPAGRLLDQIIARAFHGLGKIRWAFTNVVACIPRDGEGGKLSQPDRECIRKCSPRLVEFTGIARPRLVVAVGTVARDAIDPKTRDGIDINRILGKPTPSVDILHPAAILRANLAQRGLLIQRAIVTVCNAIQEHLL